MTIERYMPGDTESGGLTLADIRPMRGGEDSPRKDELDTRYNELRQRRLDLDEEVGKTPSEIRQMELGFEKIVLDNEQKEIIANAAAEGILDPTEIDRLAQFYIEHQAEIIAGKVNDTAEFQRIKDIQAGVGVVKGALNRKGVDLRSAAAEAAQMTRPEAIPPAPGTVRLRYKTDYGPRETDVPVNPVEQRKMLIDALTILENTREPEGSLAYSNAIKEFNYMVLAMGQHSEYKEQAGKLIEEYQARTSFHKIFLNYERAADIKGVKDSVDQFLDTWMDKIITDKDYRAVRYALQYYKENGKNFVGMENLDHLKNARKLAQQHKDETGENDPIFNLMTRDDFRKAAIVSIKDDFKKKKEVAERAKVVASPEDKDKIHPEEFIEPRQDDLEAMCNLAERFWTISGTKIAQVQTYEKVIKENGVLRKTGEVNWVDGSVDGGDFQVRDVERFRDRIITRKESLKPHMEVFDALDGISEVKMDSKDFITYMEDKIKDKAKQDDQVKAALKEVKDKDGNPIKDKDGNPIMKLDFTSDFWDGYKFISLENKDRSMFQWSLFNLQFPSGNVKDFQAYIQEPTDENFLKAGKGFSYKSDDRFDTSISLIQHRVKFLKSDEATRYGLEKPSLAGFDNMIEHWGRELNLEPEKQKEIVDKLLGSGAWADVAIFWSHIRGNNMLLALFWELLWGILKEGAKPV